MRFPVMRFAAMRFFVAMAGLLIALNSALAQGITPNYPGVQPPVPAPVYRPSAPINAPGPYMPPRIDSFGDRVTRSLHSFPLQGGLPGQPTDRDMYVRQNANR